MASGDRALSWEHVSIVTVVYVSLFFGMFTHVARNLASRSFGLSQGAGSRMERLKKPSCSFSSLPFHTLQVHGSS